MDISFHKMCKSYGRPKGIIHIGAHRMEERKVYRDNGFYNTIWIEANPKLYKLNQENILDSETLINNAISDVDKQIISFNITNNGQSSSLLDLHFHKEAHPNVVVSETVEVRTRRMDCLLLDLNVDLDDYDFINIDVQGAELLALKGFGKMLSKFKYIYSEVNIKELYKNCCLIEDLDSYLTDFNFIRCETKIFPQGWGEAFYVKK
jgi:FkbM family methyltransferase